MNTDQLERLIRAAEADGVTVAVTADSRVKLSGPTRSLGKWRATLAPYKQDILGRDLGRLIRQSADFWHYDEDDTRLIRDAASKDPPAMRLALLSDPLAPHYLRPKPDRSQRP